MILYDTFVIKDSPFEKDNLTFHAIHQVPTWFEIRCLIQSN